MSEKDLESKVFVDTSSPDKNTLVLDDKLVLTTKFVRVKKKTFMHNSQEQHILLFCNVSTTVRF